MSASDVYRGRLAPSPTGLLHLGHARTFYIAHLRARERSGALVLRNEDLDRARCRPDFVAAMLEDLKWLGVVWQEGPDISGPYAPYAQSERGEQYRTAFDQLVRSGRVFPCSCSRKDVARALQAPHPGEDEPVYPGTCRPPAADTGGPVEPTAREASPVSRPVSWRFRVDDGEVIEFVDGFYGPQRFVAGRDFGDFVVWRQDGSPSYQLAVVVDDSQMHITEVVRGADLLKSTARQILLYRALGLNVPQFYHCPLMTGPDGTRLAKRHDALSLRQLRAQGSDPAVWRAAWHDECAS